jgi:hypothetical protein
MALVGQRQDPRARLRAHRLFHADDAADDRRGNLWLFFYTPGFGVLDQIGALFGAPSVNWLGQPETALWAVCAVTIWKEAGFFMIFYLAALQTIPPDLREAAEIEGASAAGPTPAGSCCRC